MGTVFGWSLCTEGTDVQAAFCTWFILSWAWP